MLARSRFEQYEECDILLSKLASEGHPHMHTFYEWINPITDHPSFADILQKIKKESVASRNTKKDNRKS
ncbi:MAG: hypothetical protein WBZ20_10775 [Nitrososphaeraceae archaeon]